MIALSNALAFLLLVAAFVAPAAAFVSGTGGTSTNLLTAGDYGSAYGGVTSTRDNKIVYFSKCPGGCLIYKYETETEAVTLIAGDAGAGYADGVGVGVKWGAAWDPGTWAFMGICISCCVKSIRRKFR